MKIQRSSKNRALEIISGILWGRSLIDMLNKVGFNTVPCGTPFCKKCGLENVCPIRTTNYLLLKKCLMKNKVLPRMFHEYQLWRILRRHVVLQASVISNNGLYGQILSLCKNLWMVVDWKNIKNVEGHTGSRKFYGSFVESKISLSFTIFSKISQRFDMREISRQLSV